MRGADKIDCLFHSHGLAVDIARPYIADPLLAFQIILCHLLQGDRCVFKLIYLPQERFPAFKSGVEHNEDQYGGNDYHVDNNDYSLFHAQISLEKPSHGK